MKTVVYCFFYQKGRPTKERHEYFWGEKEILPYPSILLPYYFTTTTLSEADKLA
jgi:hypothetical protein